MIEEPGMIDEPVVTVHIPPELRRLTQGRSEVMASGDTVGKVLESLDHEHPGVLSQLLSASGQIDPSHEVWLGGSNVSTLEGLATPVGLEELISIVPTARSPALASVGVE